MRYQYRNSHSKAKIRKKVRIGTVYGKNVLEQWQKRTDRPNLSN